jgi:hypothetical protein
MDDAIGSGGFGATLKRLGSESMTYGLSTIVGRLICYLLQPHFAHHFDPAQNGIQSVVYSYVPIISSALYLGMDVAYMRNAASVKEAAPAQPRDPHRGAAALGDGRNRVGHPGRLRAHGGDRCVAVEPGVSRSLRVGTSHASRGDRRVTPRGRTAPLGRVSAARRRPLARQSACSPYRAGSLPTLAEAMSFGT